ncbi:transmembrane protein 165 [Galendromus occidentalis]|uniref:GDT1 family protein n=1 Tax=Galendromus occidentalis TaxID=34638 RepID=A0AAJ6QXI1_9ACAR|nr:transmembrane protein 165 [Galendromus occidentalis]
MRPLKDDLCFWLAFLVCLVHVPDRIFAKDDFEDDIEENTMNSSSGTMQFLPGFLSSLSLTLVSELGDKTFFIAAILAMRNSRVTVFLGSFIALVFMTIVSVALGFAANIVPPIYTHFISIGLFILFGLKMIYDAYRMSPDEGLEEFHEVEKTLLDHEKKASQPCEKTFLSGTFWQALTMTLVAEWGDRSQISTILLATRSNIYGVIFGTILGHSLCTLLAVVAGRLVAHKISVKTVAYIGGVVFLGCALFEFLSGYEDSSSTLSSTS